MTHEGLLQPGVLEGGGVGRVEPVRGRDTRPLLRVQDHEGSQIGLAFPEHQGLLEQRVHGDRGTIAVGYRGVSRICACDRPGPARKRGTGSPA